MVGWLNYREGWYLGKVKESYEGSGGCSEDVKGDRMKGLKGLYDYKLCLEMNRKLYGM